MIIKILSIFVNSQTCKRNIVNGRRQKHPVSRSGQRPQIGIDHIVEFLSKKGIAVEKKPTAKISSEAYDLLQKEFAQDKQIKQVAQEITKEKQRKENIVIEAKPMSSSVTEKKPAGRNFRKAVFHIKQEAAENEKQKKAPAKETELNKKLLLKKKSKAKKKLLLSLK